MQPQDPTSHNCKVHIPFPIICNIFLANTYVLGIIDGTYVGMCEDTGTI